MRWSWLLLLLLGCGPAVEVEHGALIGGRPASAGELDAAGALLRVDTGEPRLWCSVVLIAQDVALTAAHCTEDQGMLIPEDELRVSFAGEVGSNAEALDVNEVAVHPDWQLSPLGGDAPEGLGRFNDLALLFLTRTVDDVDIAVIVDEPPSGLIVSAPVIMAGYGAESPSGADTGRRFIANSEVNELDAYEMQIGSLEMPVWRCAGDSGGPTYLEVDDGRLPRSRVVGIGSRAYDATGCTKGSVDTRIEAYFDWIFDTMISACADNRRLACQRGVAPRAPRPAGDDAGVMGVDGGAGEDDDGGCRCLAASPQPRMFVLLLLLAAPLLRRRRSVGGRQRRLRYCR